MRCAVSTIILTLGLMGCSTHSIELSAAPGQEKIIRDGSPTLVSKKRAVVMLRSNTRQVKGSARPAFTIAVWNPSNKNETLYESQITATQSLSGKAAPVRVYRYAELVQEEQNRQTVAAIGAALAGAGRAMSAANAGYVNTTGSVNAYSPYGNSYGTYTATTYDPLRAQVAQNMASAQTANDFDRIQAQGEANLGMLQQTILKDNTVLPGEWYGGTVVLDPPAQNDKGASNFEILVPFAGEEHVFNVAYVTD